MLILLRHTIPCPEVAHIDAAWSQDEGDLAGSTDPYAIGTGTEHASADLVRQFGRGNVQNAGNVPVGDQALHGSAAAASRVEDQDLIAVVLKGNARAVDAGCGVAEH